MSQCVRNPNNHKNRNQTQIYKPVKQIQDNLSSLTSELLSVFSSVQKGPKLSEKNSAVVKPKLPQLTNFNCR